MPPLIPSAKDEKQQRRRSTFRPSAAGGLDLLQLPVLGTFLKWPWSRVVLQIPLLLIAVVMIGHGLFGPELAPKNLAALLTWVHFRGLVVLVILLAGNFFCMACPFMLPRALARRFIRPKWSWPRRLRNKWLSVACFVGVLFVYEVADLWAEPFWTAVLILAYFAAALGVDLFFQRASFCKYVCPIGQFNFVSSTLSPLEVSPRSRDVCVSCRTTDCITGQKAGGAGQTHVTQRGCELDLYQPRKVGNLDCTFCLDCVYACPHDNVGIHARLPGEELGEVGPRSGLGKVSKRADLNALVVVFVFAALLNALAMVSPIYAVERAVADALGLRTEWPILLGLFGVLLILEPAILLGGAALLTKKATGSAESLVSVGKAFARSLAPLGFGIWLAHYGFHFFAGFLTVVPVTQHALNGLGAQIEPQWQLGGLSESAVWTLEMGFLFLGLLGSLLVTYAIASDFAPQKKWRAFVPWALVSLILAASALWVLNQPMDMRGTFLGA